MLRTGRGCQTGVIDPADTQRTVDPQWRTGFIEALQGRREGSARRVRMRANHKNFNDIQTGDQIETYEIVEVAGALYKSRLAWYRKIMPKDYPRALRVADQIQRELSDLIRNELKDPRIGMITLTGVEVSHDYSSAKVFYTTLGNASDNFLTANGLEHSAGFLRSHLSHRLKLRVILRHNFSVPGKPAL